MSNISQAAEIAVAVVDAEKPQGKAHRSSSIVF